LNAVIQKHPEKPWNWDSLSYHKALTFETVVAFSTRPWDWYQLSQKANITWDIIYENLHLPWCWRGIGQNPSITWDIIRAHLDEPWHWDSFRSSEITRNIIRAHPEKRHLFANTIEYYDYHLTLSTAGILRVIRQYIAARTIQWALKEAYCNPEYKLCRTRLRGEFEGLRCERVDTR
jgi:hypothetical protein